MIIMVKLRHFILCIVPLLLSCGGRIDGISINSPKVEILKKLYSPDKKKLVLLYKLENQSNEKSSLNVSIIDSEDTLTNIYKNILPSFKYVRVNSCVSNQNGFVNFEPLKWANNKRLIVEIDTRLFARAGFAFENKTVSICGIELEIHSKYSKNHNEPFIYHYDLSPDKSKLLVFHRNAGLKDENVSVIDYDSNLLLYGNIYTSENPNYESYYIIEYGQWKDKTVQLAKRTSSPYPLNNKINVPINLIKEFSEDSPKLEEFNNTVNTDAGIDAYLKKNPETTYGIISSMYVHSQKEKLIYTYEYRYSANNQNLRSRFMKQYKDITENEFKDGDTIAILFDRKQPIIHRPLINYSH